MKLNCKKHNIQNNKIKHERNELKILHINIRGPASEERLYEFEVALEGK